MKPFLTPSQEHVLALISAGSSISAAAQAAQIHRNTVHHWVATNSEFRIGLIQAREAKAFYWREQAEELASSAIDTVRALMSDPTHPAAVRLKAAQSILTLATTPVFSSATSVINYIPAKLVHNSAQEPVGQPRPSPEPLSLASSSAASVPDSEPSEWVNNSAQQPVEQRQSSPEASAAAPAPPTAPTPANAVRHSGPQVGRNEACPCGSGKKFKRCCLDQSPARAPQTGPVPQSPAKAAARSASASQ